MLDTSGNPIAGAMVKYDCTTSSFRKDYYEDSTFTDAEGRAAFKYPQHEYTHCDCSIFVADFFPQKKSFEGVNERVDSFRLQTFDKTINYEVISYGNWGHGNTKKAEFLTINGNPEFTISELLQPYIEPITFENNDFTFKAKEGIKIIPITKATFVQLFKGKKITEERYVPKMTISKYSDSFLLKIGNTNDYIVLNVSSINDQRRSDIYKQVKDKRTSFLLNMYKISFYETPQENATFLDNQFFYEYFYADF